MYYMRYVGPATRWRCAFTGAAIIAFLFCLQAASPPTSEAQSVVRFEAEVRSLSARMDWAQEVARSRSFDSHWVVYSIRRMMGENSWIGSFGRDWREAPTLESVLTGTIPGSPGQAESLRNAAQEALDRANGQRSDRKVEKDVAVLFRFHGARLDEVDLSNLDLHFDFEDVPVIWLGAAEDRESIDLLSASYAAASDDDCREDLVAAVGMHDDVALVRPFLLDIIESRAPEDVRADAVFWLHRDESPESVRYLARLAEDDRADEVREQAVFALSRMAREDALDRLIALARFDGDDDVREDARFWLGQKASSVLVGNVDDDGESTNLQKQAVFALTQMDDGGIAELIELVHHHANPVVRKQALFWLGQSEDERALETIIAVLRPGS